MKNELLRHMLSTIEYRFNKSISNWHKDAVDFCAGNNCRTPKEIIHHMYQVLQYARTYIPKEKFVTGESELLGWTEVVNGFRNEINEIQIILSENEIEIDRAKKLIQGPFSDVITHVGQLAMLSRLNGNPVKGENYMAAEIITGV